MFANTIKDIPVLGVGMGFRTNYRTDIFRYRKHIDFLEVIGDHYFKCDYENGDKKLEELDLLNEYFDLVPHSLSLSVGSAEGSSDEYIAKIKLLADRINPAWCSDHICFTKAHGVDLGHLGELPFTREALNAINDNLTKIKKSVNIPFVLENISYTMGLPCKEMSEYEFVSSIMEENNCGMLLDVTNLYANCINHKYNAFEFLDNIPLDKVVQLHFVGGKTVMQHGEPVYLDSHSNKTPEDIWILMDEVISRCKNLKGVILERDTNFPDIEDLLEELERARKIGRKYKRWP